jgi:hypothetical protein
VWWESVSVPEDVEDEGEFRGQLRWVGGWVSEWVGDISCMEGCVYIAVWVSWGSILDVAPTSSSYMLRVGP